MLSLPDAIGGGVLPAPWKPVVAVADFEERPAVRHLAGRAARRAAVLARRPPHYEQWLCIHRHEGAWDANTGNGYYGGLQMDLTFQRMYGPELLAAKGTADRWTPLEQMSVAERAWQTRGFGPWPNTARICGLL